MSSTPQSSLFPAQWNFANQCEQLISIERTVTAHGRGLAPQTPFTLTPESASVRVPRSCRVAATLDFGGGESWALEATALQLDAASQMVWRQLGARPSQLRVQLKLVPAAGGYTVTTKTDSEVETAT